MNHYLTSLFLSIFLSLALQAQTVHPLPAHDTFSRDSTFTTNYTSETLTEGEILFDTVSVQSAPLLQSNQGDYKFNPKQLILPGALIAVGTVGVYSDAFGKLNRNIQHAMTKLRGHHYFMTDDYLQYLPALTYLSFGSIGIRSKHNLRERAVIEATSYLAMTAMVNIGKYSFREMRPDSSRRNSFPSGHTATVFTGAELMRLEYSRGLGIAAYSVAVGVAFLRVYNDRHWFNDIIAGAGVGILSARIGYWMLPLYCKWFKWDRNKSTTTLAVVPVLDTSSRNFGFGMMASF